MENLKYSFMLIAWMITAGVANAGDSPQMPVGQLNYMLQCQGCHKADGEGIGSSVPSLRAFGSQLLNTAEGRQFYVSVPGSANAPLSDAELADVLNFIISDILKVSDLDDSRVERFTVDEIAQYRPIRIADVGRLRARLVGEAVSPAAGGDSER